MIPNKTLFFYWYASDNYTTDTAYKFHLECLGKYIHIFNKCVFVIAVDNLNDYDLITRTETKIIEKCKCPNIEFHVMKNDTLKEVNMYKKYVENYNSEYNELIFFGHTKGTRIIDSFPFNTIPYLKWIFCLYFYSFNRIEEVDERLLGRFGGNQSAFYIPIKIFEVNKFFVPGTFFWMNKNQFDNDIRNGIVTIDKINNSAFCENLTCSYGFRPDKIASYNNITIENLMDNYFYENVSYDEITMANGDHEQFNNEFLEIINKIL